MASPQISPRLLKEPWPEPIREAVAWHESGHAIMTAHYGGLLTDVWICDGRFRVKMAHPDGYAYSEDPRIAGASDSLFKGNLKSQMMASIANGIGPTGAEALCPHTKEFKTLHTRFPDYYPDGGQFLLGSYNDLQKAIGAAVPYYLVQGVVDPIAMSKQFEEEFFRPTILLVGLYRTAVRKLSEALIEERYLDGRTAHEIICKGVHLDSLHMEGCNNGTINDELNDRINSIPQIVAQLVKEGKDYGIGMMMPA